MLIGNCHPLERVDGLLGKDLLRVARDDNCSVRRALYPLSIFTGAYFLFKIELIAGSCDRNIPTQQISFRG